MSRTHSQPHRCMKAKSPPSIARCGRG
jgi:hypothetical protein